MIAYRLLRIAVHLSIGLWTCGLIFPFTDAAGRTRRIQRWSLGLMKICRVRIDIQGSAGVPGAVRALIVANHVSWIDIFVINTMLPCRFVAKSDIRDWPVLGWLCEKAGTVFISRGRMRDVRKIYQGLVTSIHAGEHIAFFPEGTTAAQGGLLPFHANLFEAAIDAQVVIQPYAVRYVHANGALHDAVEFIGETTFAASLVLILRTKGITAQLIALPAIATQGAHRRDLAQSAQQAIATALGHRSATPVPDR